MTLATRLDPLPDLPHAGSRSLGLDLLRAIAILLVMVSHYANNVGQWFGWHAPQRVFFAGDLGVHLFFALSGFLIGVILIRLASEAPTGRGLGIFLVRRWMRTLPVYFVWLVVLFAWFPPTRESAGLALRFATLTQNLLVPMPHDYFFAVSWSLAIEEWFYLLFASALILATRAFGRPGPALALCLAVFMLGPLALRWALLDYTPLGLDRMKEVFFRIDEIAYGVLMAWLWLRRSWLFRHPWPLLAAGLLLVAATWFDRLPLFCYPALTFNAAVIGCALCLPAALRLRRAPGWFAAPVRLVSALSYALYVIHLTILIDVVQNHLWAAHLLSAPAAAAVTVLFTFILAWLSFRFFETPILRHRPSQERAARAGLVPVSP